MRTTRTLAALVACALVAPTGWPTLSESRRDRGEVVSTSPNVLEPFSADSRRESATRTDPRRAQTVEDDIRELLRQLGMGRCGALGVVDDVTGFCFIPEDPQITELRALGEVVHPVVERAIANPGSSADLLRGIGNYLSEVPAGRERFRATIVRRLHTPDLFDTNSTESICVRRELCRLLEDFGTEHDAHALVPLLAFDHRGLQCETVRALARIGGENELRALDFWLTQQNHECPYVKRIRGLRDEFARRLANE